MSLCLRPVVEKWGEGLTFLSREEDIGCIIAWIVDCSNGGSGVNPDGLLTCARHDYNENEVVWIDEGAKFCDWLKSADPKAVIDFLADNDVLSSDDDEYERQCSDVRDIIAAAEAWRASIDPDDGSLRIYCDR